MERDAGGADTPHAAPRAMTTAPAPISAADTSPLTAAETETIRGMLAARTRLAHRFSALAAAPSALFVLAALLRPERSGRSDELLLVAACLGVLALVSWIVWHFGWRLVRDMRADLSAGRKQIVRGVISSTDSQKNAYGETITHLVVQGLKLVSRSPEVAAWKSGQRVAIECLPRSKVVFRGQLEEPTV